MKILGIGAALVDLLAHVDDAWLNDNGASRGGMSLVDFGRALELVSSLSAQPVTVPGGSACNTLCGYARLGGSAAFLGKTGRDELGDLFARHLERLGVQASLLHSQTPTGRVLSAVTPDAQRSMFTCLGASAELVAEEIVPSVFDGVDLVYLEGYLAFNAPVFGAVLRNAVAHKCRLALDLASFDVVQACRSQLEDAVAAGLEVLVANEDEAKAWTGLGEEESLEALAPFAKVVVVKLGARGALIAKDGRITRVAAKTTRAIDTTGAGDLWASGFLYGLGNGWSMEAAGQLAASVACEVVSVVGTVIPEEGWARIEADRNSLRPV